MSSRMTPVLLFSLLLSLFTPSVFGQLSPFTRRVATIPNAGGLAVSGDGTKAFISTTSTSSPSVYWVPVPIVSAATLYYTSTVTRQFYYIAASSSTSPQLIYLMDNQNAQLLSLPFNVANPSNTTTVVYDFGIANLDLIDSIYYQKSTQWMYFACYDHFGGSGRDYVGAIDLMAASPRLINFYQTSLIASLAAVAVSSTHLYYGSSTNTNNAAQIFSVPLPVPGTATAPLNGTASTVLYTTPESDQSQTIDLGVLQYPGTFVLSADESVLYMTDIGDQAVQAPTTPHGVFAVWPLYSQTFPLNFTSIYQVEGQQTEVQQSFGLSADQSTIYFAATGTLNGMYQILYANVSFISQLPPPPTVVAPTATARVSSSAAASAAPASSAASSGASASSAASAASSSLRGSAGSSSSQMAASSMSAAQSSAASASQSSAASAAQSSAVSAAASSTPSVSVTSAGVSQSSSGGSSGQNITYLPVGTVSMLTTFGFSDTGDSVSCLTADSTTTLFFAASSGGDIYNWSLGTSLSSIAPAFVAGTGSTGSYFTACQANAAGTQLYLLDTRGKTLVRYTVATPTVAPVTIATFSQEAVGAVTSLAIDFTANFAYVGTVSSDYLYSVDLTITGQFIDQLSLAANNLPSDVTSLALSADRRTLYFGSPAPVQGSPGTVKSVAVVGGTVTDSSVVTNVASSNSFLYPDSLLVVGSTVYVKDGGALKAHAGPSSSYLEAVYAFTVGTRVTSNLTTIFSTLSQNLPSGLVLSADGSRVYMVTAVPSSGVSNFESVLVVPVAVAPPSTSGAASSAGSASTGAARGSSSSAAVSTSSAPAASSTSTGAAGSVSSLASSAAAASSRSAASAASTVSSSAAPASSPAAAASSSSSAGAVLSAASAPSSSGAAGASARSSSAASVSSSAAAVSSSAASVSSAAATPSSSAATSNGAALGQSSSARASSSSAAAATSAQGGAASTGTSRPSTAGGTPPVIGGGASSSTATVGGDSSSSSSLSGGKIAGIVIGSVVGALLICLALVFCIMAGKRRSDGAKHLRSPSSSAASSPRGSSTEMAHF